MSPYASALITVHGRVQGVYFRAFTQHHAGKLGLTGYVRNLPGGRSVELRAEGERQRLEQLVKLLHVGPQGAVVDAVETEWADYLEMFEDFSIRY